MTDTEAEHALEQQARRAAQLIGLIARKSRWRKHTIDNFGRFMLLELYSNRIMDGVCFDMTAEQVIEYCQGLEPQRPADAHT